MLLHTFACPGFFLLVYGMQRPGFLLSILDLLFSDPFLSSQSFSWLGLSLLIFGLT